MDVQYYLSKKWNLTTVVDSDGMEQRRRNCKGRTVTDASSTPADIPAVIAGAKLWLD